MSWLTPLGFLGLIGLIVWLIIYLIKPNYQHKIISSTFVWKLSLKYRKKKLPINKLRNILLIICQILTIVGLAMGMARPIIEAINEQQEERIVILDASADMLATLEGGGENRFERAIAQIHTLADEVAENEGKLSIILANAEPEFLVQRAGEDFLPTTHEKLEILKDASDYQCSYGVANIDGAMKLAETVLEENPFAKVMLYTGTSYLDPGDVTVVDVSDINEWNAAILKAEALNVENYYEFRIDLASYGRDSSIEVFLDIYGVNEVGETLNLSETVLCTQEMGTVTLTFGNDQARADTEQNYILLDVYAYDYAYIHIDKDDSLQLDNTLYLYGGTKPVLRVQYYSTRPNPFYSSALMALRDIVDDRWDIELVEVKDIFHEQKPVNPAFEGFDIYIFEHTMPSQLPTDGLVIIVNPDQVPQGSGIYLGPDVAGTQETFLTAGTENHPLMNKVNAENISVTMYKKITMYDPAYEVLMYCGSDPLMLARNEEGAKLVIMPFSLHYSNLALTKEFPTLMYNLLEHYVPCTVTEHLYEVNDTVTLNARGQDLNVEGPGVEVRFEEFPNELLVKTPGVYTLSQIPISGIQVIENIYVKMPAGESNIKLVEDTLTNPYVERIDEITDQDLIFWFAMALVALLFLEWWLQSKEYF